MDTRRQSVHLGPGVSKWTPIGATGHPWRRFPQGGPHPFTTRPADGRSGDPVAHACLVDDATHKDTYRCLLPNGCHGHGARHGRLSRPLSRIPA